MRFFLLVFFTGISMASYAQKISGTVYDSENQPLLAVIVKLYDAQNKLVEFVQTDANGYFASKSNAAEVDYLVLSKLGFEDFRINLRAQNSFTFQIQLSALEKPITYLDEVEVKAPTRLYNLLDTLTYQADSLRDQNVVTVEDLVSRIPGVSIDVNTGRIHYQNKPISTILIDGDNLTGANYQTFSKNISDRIAQEVQVIDGFEENPFLKSFKRSAAVALNIKTDSNQKVINSGSFQAGGGYQDRYVGSANLLSISRKSKNLFTSSLNNVGEFSFGQNFNLEKKTIDDQLLKTLFSTLSQDFLSQLNPVLRMRYNQNLSENDEFFVSDNLQLKSTKKEFLIKSYLYKDVLSQEKSDFFSIKSGFDETVFINQRQEESTPAHWGFSFNHNYKLTERLRWENQWMFQRKSFDQISVLNNDETVFQNELGNKQLYLKSDIFLKPSSKFLAYSYNSFTLNELADVFVLSGESIFVPDNDENINPFEQDYFSRNLHFNNTTGIIFRKGAHHIFEWASQFDYHKTDNLVNGLNQSDFENTWYNYSWIAKWSKAVRTTLFEAGLKGSLLTGNQSPNKFLMLPNLRYKWKNIFTNVDVNFYRELTFLDNKYWINDLLSTGFQSFITSTVSTSNTFFSVSNFFNSNVFYNTKRGLLGLGLNFQAIYTPLNFIPNFSSNDKFFISSVLPFDADDYSINTNIEISKYVPGLSQNFNITPAHTYSRTVYASKEDVFKNESNSYSIKFETKSAYDGWLNFYTGLFFRNQVFSDRSFKDGVLIQSLFQCFSKPESQFF
jgi:hypothetical protein